MMKSAALRYIKVTRSSQTKYRWIHLMDLRYSRYYVLTYENRLELACGSQAFININIVVSQSAERSHVETRA